VSSFRFTRRAEADLQEIAEYTYRTWGKDQCARYLGALEECCRRLADRPAQGRACDDVRPGYLRAEQGRHVVFFRKDERGILIVRILHARMLPERHLSDQDETDV
jgi:toxin ParE1/3/4